MEDRGTSNKTQFALTQGENMSDLNYEKLIILVPGVVFNHSLKTYRDVTRKADT